MLRRWCCAIIVESCFVPDLHFIPGKNDEQCRNRLDAIDSLDPNSRMVRAFGAGSSDFGLVGQVFQRLMPTLRPGVPVVYVGYPGLEIDPEYRFDESGPVGHKIAAGAAYLKQRQQDLVHHFTSALNPIVYVPLVERFRCHENTGKNALISRPNPADCRGRDSTAWLWDVPENPSVLYDDKGVRPGLNYDGPSTFGIHPHYRSEFYHYNPKGHEQVFEAVRDATRNLPIPNTSSWSELAPKVAMGSRIGQRGVCNPVWVPEVIVPDLKATVTLPDGRVIDATAPGACIPGDDGAAGRLTIRVASPFAKFDHTYTLQYVITDDGDAVAPDVDNCPTVANPDQHDANGNGVGDACDDSAGRLADKTWPKPHVYGDPHLMTLDGRGYDLQSAGEFTLVRIPSEGLELQVRFVPLQGSRGFSLASAYAFRDGYDTVEMRCGKSEVTPLLNGRPLTVSGMTRLRGSRVSIENDRFVVRAYSGMMLSFDRLCRVGLSVAPQLATTGLLGNNDRDPGNDLMAADGTQVPDGDRNALHGWFADSWRVTDQTSLFTYEAGKSTASYTDKSFPNTVTRLANFTTAELERAAARCQAAGVTPGVAMEACMLDFLVTADEAFAEAAAAVPAGVVDPARAEFDQHGVLRETFDQAVSHNLAGRSYVQVTPQSRAVGPLADIGGTASTYQFVLASIPRHERLTVSARLLVLADAAADKDNQRVQVQIGNQTAVLELEGAGRVVAGPAGTTVTADGNGTLTSGMPYTAYRVTVPVTDSRDTIKTTLTPQGFHAVLNTALAVDEVEVRLDVTPADVKAGLTVPFTAGSGAGPRMGTIETAGGADEYRFTLAQPTDLLVETSRSSEVRAHLVDSTTRARIEPSDRSFHLLYRGLPAGDYTLVVTSARAQRIPTYQLPVLVAPSAQTFTMSLGQTITDNRIGTTKAPGAGNLETTASIDDYRFEVDTAGRWVFESGGILPVCRAATLIQVSTGKVLGEPCRSTGTRLIVDLKPGEYRLLVNPSGFIGSYRIATYPMSDPQEFSYTLGQTVSNGTIGQQPAPGAGNLETPASVDIYRFTVAPQDANRTWLFLWQPVLTLCIEAQLFPDQPGAKPLGSVCLPGTDIAYTLPAGNYKIVVPTSNSRTGGYSFSSVLKQVQTFDWTLGEKIEKDRVGNRPAPGAGNLEAHGHADVYRIQVTPQQAGTWVFDASNGSAVCAASLTPVNPAGKPLGSICGRREYHLEPGEYQLEVSALRRGLSNGVGSYWITSTRT